MPTAFRHLVRNVARNDVGAAVTCLNYGLSDANGATEFYIAPELSANASMRNVADRSDAVTVTAATLTLDAWVETFGVVPGFIKCDVEGAELLVFRGGESTLETHRPAVLVELLRKWAKPYGYHPNDVISLFAKYGYTCFAVTDGGLRPVEEVTEETVETNFVFADLDAHRDGLKTLVVD
jgi:FkbM family methyltransferase